MDRTFLIIVDGGHSTPFRETASEGNDHGRVSGFLTPAAHATMMACTVPRGSNRTFGHAGTSVSQNCLVRLQDEFLGLRTEWTAIRHGTDTSSMDQLRDDVSTL